MGLERKRTETCENPCCSDSESAADQPRLPPGDPTETIDSRVCRTIEFLEHTGFREFRADALARRVGLSYSRLAHLFNDEVGMSLRCYVKRRRLRHAAHLLITTDERVSEILYAVGFTDFSNFNHAFKNTFGLSPSEYRVRGRNGRRRRTAREEIRLGLRHRR